MRLWLRLALAMVMVAAAPVVFATWSSVDVASRGAEDASVDALRREAELRAQSVSAWLESEAVGVLAWATWLGGDRMTQLPAAAQAALPVAVARATAGAVTVVLVDGAGEEVAPAAGATDPARVRALVDRLPLAAAQREPGLVHLGEVWQPEGVPGLGSAPSVPMAVLAAGGERPADRRILGVEIRLDPGPAVASDTVEHSVALVDRAGAPLRGDPGLVAPERLRQLVVTDRVVDFRHTIDDVDVIGTLAPVGGSPGWSVVVAEPAALVFATSDDIRRRTLPILALAGAVAALVGVVVARSLSSPVERLRDAAERVAEGALGTRADIARTDEIGELARTFDHMSARLLDSQREIAAFNQDLQRRVDERTRELRAAQDQLVAAGQLAAVAELGAGLAHELNNPLAGVLGLAQVLRAQAPDDPLLAELERAAARCRDVVVAWEQVRAPPATPGADLAVDALLVATAALVGPALGPRGVTMTLPGPTARIVRFDLEAGSRVLAQLIGAWASGLSPGATLAVTVSDGPGLAALTWVSDRPASERQDDRMASGHALWVARQLLDRLGGQLEVAGDRFTVRLPLAG